MGSKVRISYGEGTQKAVACCPGSTLTGGEEQLERWRKSTLGVMCGGQLCASRCGDG